jgi:hypothetical protein
LTIARATGRPDEAVAELNTYPRSGSISTMRLRQHGDLPKLQGMAGSEAGGMHTTFKGTRELSG